MPVEGVEFVDAQGSLAPPGRLTDLKSVDRGTVEIRCSNDLRNADLKSSPDDGIAADRIEVRVPCEEMS